MTAELSLSAASPRTVPSCTGNARGQISRVTGLFLLKKDGNPSALLRVIEESPPPVYKRRETYGRAPSKHPGHELAPPACF